MPYPDCTGMNLSWETLEGLAKHNGTVTAPSWALAEYDALHPLDLHTWPSIEAQVAALADDIAYDNHEIDEGLRAGLITTASSEESRDGKEGGSRVRFRWAPSSGKK